MRFVFMARVSAMIATGARRAQLDDGPIVEAVRRRGALAIVEIY
jgi:hypothetical protein